MRSFLRYSLLEPGFYWYHYDLATWLAELREKGVLIIGSGKIMHNLRLINFSHIDARPYGWAVEFDEWVKSNLLDWNHEDLINFERMGETASLLCTPLIITCR